MIKRLRRRFIWVAMLSVTIVLSGIIAVVNVTNYMKINSEWDSVLDILCDNGGYFPKNFQNYQRRPNSTNNMSLETPYETRYFTVTFFSNGSTAVDVNQIASVSEQAALSLATELKNSGKTSGMSGSFKFRTISDNTKTMFVFLDCSKGLSTFHNFLSLSIGISAVGLLLVFVLVILFSKIVFRPIEDSYKKQKQFITNASHDIKTPLTVINADVEVVELEQGENEWTDDIKKQIKRLTSLTEKLVFLSRMEEEDAKLELKKFNFSETVEEACSAYYVLAKSHELQLELNVAKDVFINGNEEMLGHAISLLMDNAIKYTKDCGKIVVTLKKNGKGCQLCLKNDVEKMKIGNYDELFERFYRSDKSRNSASGGHGIGLSVVKAIILSHKGKISAKSTDGNTIEFNIIL